MVAVVSTSDIKTTNQFARSLYVEERDIGWGILLVEFLNVTWFLFTLMLDFSAVAIFATDDGFELTFPFRNSWWMGIHL